MHRSFPSGQIKILNYVDQCLLTNPVLHWAVHPLLVEDDVEDEKNDEDGIVAASNQQWTRKENVNIKLQIQSCYSVATYTI